MIFIIYLDDGHWKMEGKQRENERFRWEVVSFGCIVAMWFWVYIYRIE